MSDPVKSTPSISMPTGSKFGQVDSMASAPPAARPSFAGMAAAMEVLAVAPPVEPDGDLGPLTAFTGTFAGPGFNTIFRPNNAVTPTPLPTPLNPPGDNVLELNVTFDSIAFSTSLGAVPNRGTQPQGDINLNGVPYLQTVNDITTSIPGPIIHVEPGLWMRIPATGTPKETRTLARMASIPHGTTINAQGTCLVSPTGKPIISPVDITPFPVGGTQAANPIPFPSQTAVNQGTARIPQDLTAFIAAGTITQAMLTDPNSVIRNHIAGVNITSTTVILISTQPGLPIFGGGTDNIAFLLGDPAGAKPNANAIKMEAIFWIEEVATTITVPAFTPGDKPITISPAPVNPSQPVPSFLINPSVAIPAPITIPVTYTQIQYTQTVLLVFAGLNWPHVSAATLVPQASIKLPDSAYTTPAKAAV
jgi:hypothetical protein